MSLIKEELKKIFKIKYLFTLVTILVFVGFFFTQIQIINLHNGFERDQMGKYDYFKGTITNEKYQSIVNKLEMLNEKYPMGITTSPDFEDLIDTSDTSMSGSDFSDMFVYKIVVEEINRLINFKQENNLAVEKQEEKVVYLEALGLNKLAATIAKNTDRYRDRKLTDYHYVHGMERFIQSDTAMLFSLTTLFYVCIRNIQIEKERNMELLIDSTHIGKKYHRFSKYIAVIIFSILMALFFELINFGSFYVFDILKGLEAPIYQLKSMATFPYNLTVFIALILHFLMKASFLAFCGVFITFIASNFRRVIPTVFVMILVLLNNDSFLLVSRGINQLKITHSIILLVLALLIPSVDLIIGRERRLS